MFIGAVNFLGGPASIDDSESAYATWAIEHGQFACAFPTQAPPGKPETAPVYPLLSGAVAAMARIGDAVPYPIKASSEARCNQQYTSVRFWALASGALNPTLNIAYLTWLVLLAGIVAWLRASRRGRTGWEPVALVLVAALPPVWESVESSFHPQDLLALGLALGALASARRGRWALTGALIAGAVLTQQFALLVAAPLLILAPRRHRLRYVGAAVGTAVAVAVPLLIVSSGAAARAMTLGSSNGPRNGGSVIFGLGLSGTPLVLVSRVLPILLSIALSWWAVRRFGRATVWQPATLLSLIALSLGLRLVWEQSFFPYYLMALAVLLVLLDVQAGHIRGSLFAWLTATVLLMTIDSFPFVLWSWGATAQRLIPLVVIALAAAGALVGALRHTSRWNIVLCVLVIAIAIPLWRVPENPLSDTTLWTLQVAYVGTGVLLAAGPLLSLLRQGRSWDDEIGDGLLPAHADRGDQDTPDGGNSHFPDAAERLRVRALST